MTTLPIFITGNQSKADYLSRQLGVELQHQKVDLDELQSTDLHVIVEHKLKQAYEVCQQPVLVEDVSLVFNALGELPGTIAKKPTGENGFGFDRFFINEGYEMTRAEMSQEENERTYAESMKPFAQVKKFIDQL